jgi:hypothetical protein
MPLAGNRKEVAMAEAKVRNVLADLEISAEEADTLIARYIRRDPARHGRDRARTGTNEGTVAVWMVISDLNAAGIAEVADAYDVPEEAIVAAIASYRRHRDPIDARLLLQNQAFHGE